jgi:hypothetical protein
MSTPLEDQKAKELFKQAMIELLEERKDLFYDLFAEIIEDSVFIRAIQEGETTESASREEILEILEG